MHILCARLLSRRWLFWAPLVCSVVMQQLQRDLTLDHHWELWKKANEKEYKDQVDH